VTTLWGLPAHALLVHAIVVLAPLTAVLEILCGFWPAARRNLVWLVLALAGVTTILTPITTDAGEWLKDQRRSVSPILAEHAERGDWMIYFSVALLVVALALVVLHVLERRSDRPRKALVIAVAVVTVLVGVSSIVTVARIGHSGAQSVWGG
jgi:p-aminobenzoyl-glutamate transporter AbgT